MLKRIFGQSGVASLEFVLILPILLFVLFVGAELSRAWFTLNLMTTAAREAVRAGVVSAPGSVQSNARARLDALLGQGKYTATVACNPAPCAPDSQVTVNVSMDFHTVLPNLFPMLGTVTLQQTASMRYE
jgi:Flp pilus assembly protein TadG